MEWNRGCSLFRPATSPCSIRCGSPAVCFPCSGHRRVVLDPEGVAQKSRALLSVNNDSNSEVVGRVLLFGRSWVRHPVAPLLFCGFYGTVAQEESLPCILPVYCRAKRCNAVVECCVCAHEGMGSNPHCPFLFYFLFLLCCLMLNSF